MTFANAAAIRQANTAAKTQTNAATMTQENNATMPSSIILSITINYSLVLLFLPTFLPLSTEIYFIVLTFFIFPFLRSY